MMTSFSIVKMLMVKKSVLTSRRTMNVTLTGAPILWAFLFKDSIYKAKSHNDDDSS